MLKCLPRSFTRDLKGEYIVSATDAAVKLVQESLDEKNAELDKVAGPLAAEIKELEAFLKKITRGSKTPGGPPATSDEDLIATVGKLTSAPGSAAVKSPDIAKALGVDPRTISRRLAKHASEGTIAGNKDDGYTGL